MIRNRHTLNLDETTGKWRLSVEYNVFFEIKKDPLPLEVHLICIDVYTKQSPQAMNPLEATGFYFFEYGWNRQANKIGQFTVKLIQNKHFHCIGRTI